MEERIKEVEFFSPPHVPIVFHDDGSGRYSLTEYPRNVPSRITSFYAQPQRRTKIRSISIEIKSKRRKLSQNEEEEHQLNGEKKEEEEEEVVSSSQNKGIINPPLIKDYEDTQVYEPFNSYIPGPKESFSRWQINLSAFDDIKMKPFPRQGSIRVSMQLKKYSGEWEEKDKRRSSWSDIEFGSNNYLIPLTEEETEDVHMIFTHIAIYVEDPNSPRLDSNSLNSSTTSAHSQFSTKEDTTEEKEIEKGGNNQMIKKIFLVHMPNDIIDDLQKRSRSPKKKNKEAPPLDRTEIIADKKRKLFE